MVGWGVCGGGRAGRGVVSWCQMPDYDTLAPFGITQNSKTAAFQRRRFRFPVSLRRWVRREDVVKESVPCDEVRGE